jgi:hypothetical protein
MVADQLDHVADLLCAVGEPADFAVGGARLARGQTDNIGGVSELAADFCNRARQFVCGNRCRFDIG